MDAILISHCHLDHLGALPVALSHFPHARVIMSEASAVLAPMMLRHTVKVMRRLRDGGIIPALLYSEDDVDMISYVFQGMPPDRHFPVFDLDNQGPGLTAGFYDAGHILGAAGIWLKGPSGVVFYTGDTSAQDQEIIPRAVYPHPPVDLLVLESTLGADPRAERRQRRKETQRFTRAIADVIDDGGSVLIPAFSLGRTQEMLVLLHRLRAGGRIPNVDIYTAGLGSAISEIYDRTATYTRRRNPDVRLENLDIRPLPPGDIRRGPHLRRPGIVLVSSGMMAPETMSCRLAEVMLPQERHGIFFVGYVDPDMPGYRVQEALPGEMLQLHPGGPPVPAHCRIERFHFSAHSSRRHLLRLVDRLSPKMVLPVHGDLAAQHWMQEAIQRHHPDTRVVLLEKGEEIECL